ncbi:HAD family hydrolase [Candidatus Peregrinibacteria bacterium]|nr:HAD family hydrolase [Candidatus Peregrinibacteria bacterium]
MKIDIPGKGTAEIHHALCDLNGTIAAYGKIIEGVPELLRRIQDELKLDVYLLTGDTNGNGARIAEELGILLRKTANVKEKAEVALELGAEHCVAIGNGCIDAELFKVAGLSLAVMESEGLATKAALQSDVIFRSIHETLLFLLTKGSVIATLRE